MKTLRNSLEGEFDILTARQSYIAELSAHGTVNDEGGTCTAETEQIQNIAQGVIDISSELLGEHAR